MIRAEERVQFLRCGFVRLVVVGEKMAEALLNGVCAARG